MKRGFWQGVSLLCAGAVFFSSILYGAGAVQKASALPVAGGELIADPTTSQEETSAESLLEFPSPVVTSSESSESSESSSEENLIEHEAEPPAEIKPASKENQAIEEAVKNTVNTQTAPNFATAGPALDDTPDEPSPSEEPSAPPSSVPSSEPPSPSSSDSTAESSGASSDSSDSTAESSGTSSDSSDSTAESSGASSDSSDSTAESSGASSDSSDSTAESSGTSSDSSKPSSVPSSGTTESSKVTTPQRNALEKLINMPAYTPYGKTLTIQVGGVNYKADAVVVVAGMLQAEMVGGGTDASNYPYYHAAYKAQAIACHSFVKSYNNRGSIPTGVYVRHPYEGTVRLVEQVISKMVYYNGSVAQTLYHASSGLHTQSSQYVWGGTIPYLKGVVSKYDEAPSTVTCTLKEAKAKLDAKGYDTSMDPAKWFVIQSYSDGNFIDDIKICGQDKTGYTLQSLLGLRSTKAAITFDGKVFTFAVNGWGHGVGMSQVGAMGYSRYDGWSYQQILTHYYPGCTVG